MKPSVFRRLSSGRLRRRQRVGIRPDDEPPTHPLPQPAQSFREWYRGRFSLRLPVRRERVGSGERGASRVRIDDRQSREMSGRNRKMSPAGTCLGASGRTVLALKTFLVGRRAGATPGGGRADPKIVRGGVAEITRRPSPVPCSSNDAPRQLLVDEGRAKKRSSQLAFAATRRRTTDGGQAAASVGVGCLRALGSRTLRTQVTWVKTNVRRRFHLARGDLVASDRWQARGRKSLATVNV